MSQTWAPYYFGQQNLNLKFLTQFDSFTPLVTMYKNINFPEWYPVTEIVSWVNNK